MSKQAGVKLKIKSIFGRKNPSSNASNDDKEYSEYIFNKEVLKEIGKDRSILHRVRALKEISEIVETKAIEEHSVEALLITIEDLFQATTPTEGRQAAMQFLITLVKGQFQYLGMLRAQIFRLVIAPAPEEDLHLRITLLNVLTNSGKEVSYCEQIGGFLVSFMSEALFSSNSDEFLRLLVNIVHYNSSFLDKDIICSLVEKTCKFCTNANSEPEIENCLQLLDATVRYGGLPTDGLFPLIVTLCRTVNMKNFCQPSWKLMRNLVGTKVGHTSIFIMCRILEDNNNIHDIILLRGAIFFIGMSIWGSKRVPSLPYAPLHVLPSFKISLQSSNQLVAHEVSLSLQRLVKKFGGEQAIITWDIILDIVEMLLKLLEHSNDDETESLHSSVHSILSNAEQLYAENKFCGSASRFFAIVASCAKDRPEHSVSNLLSYYQCEINPSNDDWLEVFQSILDKYYKEERRTPIRIKVLNVAASVFSLYKFKYEDEILNIILGRYIVDMISTEPDREVLVVTSQLLADILSMCSSEKYPKVLLVIEKLLSSITRESFCENLQHIEVAVDALIKVFWDKLFDPNNNYVVNIFNILVNHVNQHYLLNLSALTGGVIRKRIFHLLLSVRANKNHFIGLVDYEDKVKFSVHAIFKPALEDVAGLGKLWLVDCDFRKAFDAVLKCLKNDLDWIVLEFVLKNLVLQLPNKQLFVYCQCEISKLCEALCTMISDKTYLHKVLNCPPNMGISEFRNLIFPILSVIATYHNYLSRERQIDLVRCLEFGLNTLCVHTCVSCLTVCTLEMQDIMVKLLPQILVKLSQISATVTMSIPVLEFLSTLKEIPSLYVNFIEEQYMSIFAMALSYTDSYKYKLHIVTLAHQVISDWFTRCRMVFRKGFVTLIAKALKSSLLDAETRHRTDENKPSQNQEEVKTFHEDMSDVCLDMMARFSFSHHLSEPQRTPLVEFLLSTGISQTWLVGNMLITITTSSNMKEDCISCKTKSQQKENVEYVDDVYQTKHPNVENGNESQGSKRLSAENVLRTPRDSAEFQVAGEEEKLFGDNLVIQPGMPFEKEGNIEKYVTASSEALEGEDASCEEEGAEPTPLVAKLTQQLVESSSDRQTHVFSPSEQLLFSRQASKVPVSENVDGCDADEEDESSESEEEYFPGDEIQQTEIYHRKIDYKTEISEQSRHENDASQPECTSNVNTKSCGNDPAPTQTSSEHLSGAGESSHSNKKTRNVVNSCSCKCSFNGWAEVHIRRSTGNISWLMKIESKEHVKSVPLSDLSLMVSSTEPCMDVPFSRKLSAASSISSIHRRHSTGSIETKTSSSDELSINHIGKSVKENPCEVPEKLPLTKSYSTPRYRKKTDVDNVKRSEQQFHSFGEKRNFILSHGKKPPDDGLRDDFLCPSFVFLQLFYSPFVESTENCPMIMEQSEVIDRAMKILDRIPSFNTHKFGVIYVGYGQENSETDILSNEFGSTRYTDFIAGLGQLVKLTECPDTASFTGGLDCCTGADGKFAYIWKDETTQVVFHVATLMPTKDTDAQCVSKKRHVGNDFVSIIYDDSKHGYKFGAIKGQFNMAEVHVRPLEYGSNSVTVLKKDNEVITLSRPYIISDDNLAILVRQLAIHANIAVVTEQSKKTTNAFASNWLERLRQIKRIKMKNSAEIVSDSHFLSCDFTMYT